MNKKILPVAELIAAYNRKKDSDVIKWLMRVILVETRRNDLDEAALS